MWSVILYAGASLLVSCGVAVFGYASVVWLVAIFVLSLVLVFHPWCSFAVLFIGYVICVVIL
jgi:hypothetical protein